MSLPELPQLYEKYGKEKVDEAISFLTYRHTTPLPKDEPLDTPILYVFRHGQSQDNLDLLFSGWRDVDLTDEGVEQAEVLAEKLADKKIQMLISSDQKRTYKTMQIAMSKNLHAQGLETILDKRLLERSYGDWQGTSKLVMQLEDPKGLAEVRRGWKKPAPNGESLVDVNKRVNELLDEIIPQMKEHKINVAIACSSNSIRPIRKRFENLSEDEAANIETQLAQDYAAYPIK